MTRHYDAVVVGGRLSATIAAALLVKRGQRTLLIDQGELKSQGSDLLADIVPSPAGSLVMERVHDELGLRLESEGRLRPVKPGLQVVLPDHRLELSPKRERLTQEFARADAASLAGTLDRVKEASEEVARFLEESKELPASGFFDRRTAAATARRHAGVGTPAAERGLFEDGPAALHQTLLGLLPFITHLDARDAQLPTARLARPAQRWLQGLGQLEVEGGLRGLFLEHAERRAFERHDGAVAELLPAGKDVRLKLGHGDPDVTCDVLVDASTDLSGIEQIPSRKQKKDLALALQAARPKGRLHILEIELDARAIPPGMGRYLLLLNGRQGARDGADGPEDRPILLTRRPAGEGREALVCAHPVSSVRSHEEGVDQLEAAMRARVTRLVPFLEDASPAVRTLSGRGASGSRNAVLDHPLYDPDLDPAMGLTGVSMRTPHKGVLLAGPAVLPGLGVEGEYWSALQAVEAALVLRTGTKPKKRLLASA